MSVYCVNTQPDGTECGHHIERHVFKSIRHGAPCVAPLGNGKTCGCTGLVTAHRGGDTKAAAEATAENEALGQIVEED